MRVRLSGCSMRPPCSFIASKPVYPEAKRRMLDQVRKQDAVLTGRRVLVVDDDVRNIFALTAALEGYGMILKFA